MAAKKKAAKKAGKKAAKKPAKKKAAKKPAKAKKKAPKDDLQEISGIGPAIETKLRKLGFGTFKKIAGLDRDGVDTLAEKLGVSASKIRRERWVTKAKRRV